MKLFDLLRLTSLLTLLCVLAIGCTRNQDEDMTEESIGEVVEEPVAEPVPMEAPSPEEVPAEMPTAEGESPMEPAEGTESTDVAPAEGATAN